MKHATTDANYAISIKGDSIENWTWGPKQKIFTIDLIFIYVIPYANL